jgi:hypothetical protein
VKPNRTWVYAPEPDTLHQRWKRLVDAADGEMRSLLKETRDSTVIATPAPLDGQPARRQLLCREDRQAPEPVRVAYRSFDMQWLLPDSRLLDRPRPELWRARGPQQIYATEPHVQSIEGGPGLTFSSLIPDMHHFMGRGGRVLPLYRDAAAADPNVTPGLLRHLRAVLRSEITAEDLLAYVACVTAHPGYTARFQAELRAPGIRVPLTADPAVFAAAVEIGREVLWLHTYGERCLDASAGRPAGPPRLPPRERPKVTITIPDTPDLMPERIDYDEAARALHVGDGVIAPVPPEVWEYHVSGMRVVKKWFGYRKKNPSTKRSSALNDIRAESWTADMTGELLDLLNVLGRCVALEPTQGRLLDTLLAGPLISVTDLTGAGVLPIPALARKPPRADAPGSLWSTAP